LNHELPQQCFGDEWVKFTDVQGTVGVLAIYHRLHGENEKKNNDEETTFVCAKRTLRYCIVLFTHRETGKMELQRLTEPDNDEGMQAGTEQLAAGQDDEVICRICHDSEGVLIRPCGCVGSTARVHAEW
jgi:hypothetical protein